MRAREEARAAGSPPAASRRARSSPSSRCGAAARGCCGTCAASRPGRSRRCTCADQLALRVLRQRRAEPGADAPDRGDEFLDASGRRPAGRAAARSRARPDVLVRARAAVRRARRTGNRRGSARAPAPGGRWRAARRARRGSPPGRPRQIDRVVRNARERVARPGPCVRLLFRLHPWLPPFPVRRVWCRRRARLSTGAGSPNTMAARVRARAAPRVPAPP